MKAKCKRCEKEFDPYPYSEDCCACNDGEDDGERCFCCGGSGVLRYKESKFCKSCKSTINELLELMVEAENNDDTEFHNLLWRKLDAKPY